MTYPAKWLTTYYRWLDEVRAMRIGLICSRVRMEEKLILSALRRRSVDVDRIDTRTLAFDIDGAAMRHYDAVLIRCISHSRALYVSKLLGAQGVPTVNHHEVIATCGDKILTTMALNAQGVPTPTACMCFSTESATKSMCSMGFPVVIKPTVGSWGRLIARAADVESAESILEHKKYMDRDQSFPFYVQEHVDKPGRDIRTLVVGDETVYAVFRTSSHWITNTARGAKTVKMPIGSEINDLSLAAARAVGGGIVAIDILETPDGRLLVNEVNDTPEFHGALEAVDTDVAGKMADHAIQLAREGV